MTNLNGEWKCPKCGFILHKMLLRAADFAVAVDRSEVREVCPNDGATLVPNDDQQEENYN